MREKRMLSVDKDLKGMSVLKVDTGRKLGEATDAVVHPLEGKMLGVIVRLPEGGDRILLAADLLIGVDAIMADARARFEEIPSDRLERGVPALGSVVGTHLVTEEGRLVGRVSEVHVSTERPYVVYRVVESTLQKFFGGGFYMPADVVRAYSQDGVRMIVPMDVEDRYAASSLEDAMAMRAKAAPQKHVSSK